MKYFWQLVVKGKSKWFLLVERATRLHPAATGKWLAGLLLVAAAGLGGPQAQALGKVKLLVGGGYATPALGSISYDGSEIDEGNTGGYGIALDFGRPLRRSSFALDYYVQGGGQDTSTSRSNRNSITGLLGSLTGEEIVTTRKLEASLLLIGGRWNARRHGFYIGGGPVIITTAAEFEIEGDGEPDGDQTSPGLSFALGLTLGYDHRFSSGMTLGAHLLQTTPSPLLSTDALIGGEVNNFVVQQLSFGVGFAW